MIIHATVNEQNLFCLYTWLFVDGIWKWRYQTPVFLLYIKTMFIYFSYANLIIFWISQDSDLINMSFPNYYKHKIFQNLVLEVKYSHSLWLHLESHNLCLDVDPMYSP